MNRVPSPPLPDTPRPLAETTVRTSAASAISEHTMCLPMSEMAGGKHDWQWRSLLLCRHILTRGLLEGIGSDIVVYVPAWDKVYHLHRLVLDQNPYFRHLLQGGFCEASSSSVTLHFERNTFITADSFYFMLTQLYGKHHDLRIGHENVRQILTTCSFFQLEYVCELCVEFILRHLNERCFVGYLVFADENIVHGSDRICDAVFAYLCREAYGMSRERVAELPMRWIKKVIESDAFWVPSEYERYRFFYTVLCMRHTLYSRQQHTEKTPVNGNEDCVAEVPQSEGARCVDLQKRSSFARVPSVYSDKRSERDTDDDDEGDEGDEEADDHEKEKACERWARDDIAACKDILSHSIYYMHMTFEQLEWIRADTNPFTNTPMVPEDVLKDALWQQVRMRAKIEGTLERDTTLDLVLTDPQATRAEGSAHLYPIPSSDTTTFTGESALSRAAGALSPKSNGYENTVTESEPSPSSPSAQYSRYPPFRFSVEFSDVSSLKHGVRVYSDTVFYAGSNWNMYIQKIRSQRKGMLQLGVYLHRQSVPFEACSHFAETAAVSPLDPALNVQSSMHKCLSESTSTLSRYADKRKVVKTWFKIFCPGRGPKHTLTLFQSSPDKFSVLQSWGWRSSTLCAEESMNHSNSDKNNTSEPAEVTANRVYMPNMGSNYASNGLAHESEYSPLHSNNIPPFPSISPTTTRIATPNATLTTSLSSTLRLSVVMGHV